MADKLGVPRGRLNAWEQRGTIPKANDYQKLVDFFSLDTKVSSASYVEQRRHLKNTHTKTLDVPMYSGFTTLGNIEVIDDENVKHKVMAHLPAEVFPGCDYAEKAHGDSMHPIIQNQAVIAGKTCPVRGIVFGEKYIIKTKDGYRSAKYVTPARDFLTESELDQIEKIIKDPKVPDYYKSAANWFLFCCYSSLRYGDAAAFDMSKIVDGKIILRTEKTGADVSIPVHEKLQSSIDRINEPLTTNQDFNRILKAIAVKAGITKRLTAHLARHTFAVMWLNRGGPIETLFKLLGHTSLKTTMIYSKITNKRIEEEVGRVFS